MKDDQALRVHERLAAHPELRPVAFGEGRRFGLWDLASLAEGALGECLDPDSLTVTSEKRWRLRLGAAGREHTYEDEFRRRYWICAPEDRRGLGPVGTIAVGTWPMGAGALGVSSLYVHPVARRQGIASAALDMVYEACRAEGLYGFRLETYWTWQRTVRYYLRRGLWVTSWKHALGLGRLSYLPRYEVREGEEGELTFLVADAEGRFVPFLVAGSDDGRLRLRETEEYRCGADRRDSVRLYARSTLALHLAVRGRPLVRGEEEWAKAHWSCDIGDPEGLAYKIGIFERVARDGGWRVESPYAGLPVA
ncbi:GNAT family N-acetyltransferase [Streptomyces sp. SA15]|uniref:GNAT family N-acetyltransferase n=1 Tax=Streptomyces sp. SA15 TaxID=934019 RepID=UPI0015C82035|nr:GNAT family N-acetyltransferase [Streptomyces sp. SA15]